MKSTQHHRNLSVTIALALLAPAATLSSALRAFAQPMRDALPDAGRGASPEEKRILDSIDPLRLASWHELVTSEPHVAGTPGDERVVRKLADAMGAMGLSVEVQELWLYLPKPIAAEAELISPVQRALAVKEHPLDADPDSHHPDLMIGWSAYSGSGEATAPVVYANYGRKEDFDQLRKLGVDVAGKIVIARYGGNFRGYKAKYAEQAGATGLVIFSDPENVGYVRGLMYPDGGWATPDEIQRGSILTLPWTGDPLTPGVAATQDAKRLDPINVPMPTIPVQPLGWEAAQEILSRMTGPVVPEEWQGGLPFNYRLTSGDGGPVVRIRVEQSRSLTRTWNVIGTLVGAEHPEQKIIIGCHHDAWNFGASDPNAGTMVVLEAARVLSEQAARGDRPARSILFAHWGAEEFGVIGSTEWVEANRNDLLSNAVAYINLDAAVMGPNFGSSAAPVMKHVIVEVAHVVPSVADPAQSVFDQWAGRAREADAEDPADNAIDKEARSPRFGNLGGGSDHIAFYSYAGVPSASLGGSGAKGTSYHSMFDTLNWYRKIVGNDYEPARMVTRMTALIALRLADDAVMTLDPVRYAQDTRTHLNAIKKRAAELNVTLDATPISQAANEYETIATRTMDRLDEAARAGVLSTTTLDSINLLLLSSERAWLSEDGLADRPWYKNLFAVTDPTSGYAAWMLPALRLAVESDDTAAVMKATDQYVSIFKQLRVIMAAIEVTLDADHFGAQAP